VSNSDGYNPNDGIAVIGLAGRFPGATNPEEFWQNLCAGVESISRFEADELEPSLPDDLEARGQPGYVRARGVLEDIECFDARFFGFTPKEAEVLDPQQRLFLECAWEALEDAGYDPQSYVGSIGVFGGSSNNYYYLNNLQSRRDETAIVGPLVTMMGNEKDYLATRVSYKLNLSGPALNIQTACSTSLVAVCAAFQALSTYQCDMALAGGASVTLPQKRGYLHHEGAIVSPDGHCRAFDVNSQGTVFSNGVGIVALKRLQDALEDGDTIHAVIKGAALNNDGSGKVSFTAPSVDGQAEAIALAQALGGIDPETISYIECHGTGTELGDPIEIAGLTQAFRSGGAQGKGFCYIGSVKTNVGHLDAAAGAAGLIKTVIALREKMIPPSLHFTAPNPKLTLPESPFVVNTELRPWENKTGPRRAGVSSLGVGGTNAHVVLEEAPAVERAAPSRDEQVLLLSARSAAALDSATERLATWLEEHPDVPLADVAWTLQAGRRAFRYRRAVACTNRDDLLAALKKRNPGRVATGNGEIRDGNVAFLFPGQGAQYVQMGRRLYDQEPLFRDEVDACSAALEPHIGEDLRAILYPDGEVTEEQTARLTQTSVTQPALFVIEYALARLWMEWGVKPAAMIGHSLGEYTAACLAGVFRRDDALVLLARRARLMQDLPSGSMLAVRAPVDQVESLLCADLSIASINAPKLTVVSGNRDAVSAFADELAERKVAATRLRTSHAFHSSMMDPIVDEFAQVVATVPRQAPSLPIVSSVTGDWMSAEEATDPRYWALQLRRPVRFMEGASKLFDDPATALLEVGPGSTLAGLARQHPDRPKDQPTITSLHHARDSEGDGRALMLAAGQLWIAGAAPDWEKVHGAPRRRVSLPTYPFERKRHWIDPRPGGMVAADPHGAAVGSAIETLAAPTPEAKEEDTTPASPIAPEDRKGGLLERVRSLFADLSGIPSEDLVESSTFLELGLDSLFLTQAGTALQKAFGVKVSFRDLLEDLCTLEALAGHLDDELPPDAFAAAPTPPQAPAPASSPPAGASGPLPAAEVASSGDPLDVMAQQVGLLARQIEILRGVAPSDATRIAGSPLPAPEAQPEIQVKVPAHAPKAPAFGPYKPIEKRSGGGLTDNQQRALDDFMDRYIARTRRSKELTQEHRAHFADPRSVAGFRMLWKEIVYPIVTDRSAGSKLWDVDGNEYVDLVCGFGSSLFGHAPRFVVEAVEKQLRSGIEIGPQSPMAGQVARELCELVGMERAGFCNTGSEAVTAAIRVARTVTGRDRIAMFTGAYHGIFDEVLVRPTTIDGVLRSMPIAPGVPAGALGNVAVLEYGDPASLEILEEHGEEFAAVLVEPVQSRRPDLQPIEFVREVRRITERSGTALVFDEIVTGFRTHPKGAQALFDVRADLATYGKVLGGGLPIGVITGHARFTDALDGGGWSYGDESFPEVGVTFFAGTFVRHPLALAAARAVLTHLREQGPELQRTLNRRTTRFVDTLNEHAERAGAPVRVTHFSSWYMFNFPHDVLYASLFYAYMRAKGIHIWEGRPGFLTTAHTDEDIERVIAAFDETLSEMQEAGFLPSSEKRPPVPDARRGRDPMGREAWFVPDPKRPGKYLQVKE